MKVAAHLEKLQRLNALRDRLDASADFELWFWTTMTAGTHAINAALHSAGVTDPGDYFPTQPGVYLVPAADGAYRPAFRSLGDVLHVNRPPLDRPVPPLLKEMVRSMEIIEAHRDPCIRGAREPTTAIIADCDDAFQACLRLVRQLIQPAEHS